MRTWTFDVKMFAANVEGSAAIEIEEDAKLYGVFLVPPDNQQVAAVFIRSSLTEDEAVEDAVQKARRENDLVQSRHLIAAAASLAVPLATLTDQQFMKYMQDQGTPVDFAGVEAFELGIAEALGSSDDSD